jgi:hypothetical protein
MQFGLYDPSSSAAKILSPKFVAMSLYYCIVFLAAVRPLPCFMQIVLHAFQSPPQGRESCLRNKSTLQVVLSIFSGSASNKASRFEELMIARLIACVSQRGHCFQNLCCAFVVIIAHVALRRLPVTFSQLAAVSFVYEHFPHRNFLQRCQSTLTPLLPRYPSLAASHEQNQV